MIIKNNKILKVSAIATVLSVGLLSGGYTLANKNITLVVKNVEDWEKLKVANEKDVELGGKILIPWFYAEQIYAIPNNINIFVFSVSILINKILKIV